MRGSTGISESGARRRVCIGVLGLLDSFLSIFVIAPLVVGYWRGCWQLMDKFLLPDNKQLSVVTSLTMGVVSGLLFCLLQRPLDTLCDHSRRPRLHLFVSRLYTSVYCVCCVNHWRGVWATWDLYTGISWQSGATSMGIGLLTLAITRGLKNILAPPFIVVTDHPSGYFNVPTLFSAQKDRCGYFLLDTVFTVVVTGSLVVFVWRGSWVFLDALLFPDKPVYSAWGSMVLGMTVTLLVFVAQLVMIPCLRRIRKGLPKILVEDAYHSICFIGDVNMWRGVWMLLNIYLLPGLPVVSNFLTSVAGLVVLMCFYTSNSILVRGAVMDGAGEGCRSIVFPTHYLRFFHKKREEEQQRPDLWVRGDGGRPPLVISAPLESTLASKANGVCDGRGFGDGHSFTDGFGDGFGSAYPEGEGRTQRPNSTFLGPDASTTRVNIVKTSLPDPTPNDPSSNNDPINHNEPTSHNDSHAHLTETPL
ncbi:uncharacterized protein LOC121859013 [Homarus americanus]|uniref:uncharacterized protein LOC121859013 n=1 Tax=Homarus americanus TaxID=6706 RepID=UPI001C4779D3|nr:uncharacterized protein LOC121859013 [Homarus americanus]